MGNLNNLPTSAEQARQLGSQYYYTDEECKNGHVDKRYTSSGSCFACASHYYFKNNYHLIKYKLTVDDFDQMFIDQGGKCALCANLLQMTFDNRKHRGAVIDHDHNTGKVRAILCSGCNKALGFFNDDPIALRNAASYIEKHNAKI